MVEAMEMEKKNKVWGKVCRVQIVEPADGKQIYFSFKMEETCVCSSAFIFILDDQHILFADEFPISARCRVLGS